MFFDVSLGNGVIRIQLGKGRKNRQIGISKSLLPYLQNYLATRHLLETQFAHFFLNLRGKSYNPSSLGLIIKKLSVLSGIAITTHGLRRTFATLNAEQGKPLHLIQLALGHSDVRTTQEYLMSDQEAVIEAMKRYVLTPKLLNIAISCKKRRKSIFVYCFVHFVKLKLDIRI